MAAVKTNAFTLFPEDYFFILQLCVWVEVYRPIAFWFIFNKPEFLRLVFMFGIDECIYILYNRASWYLCIESKKNEIKFLFFAKIFSILDMYLHSYLLYFFASKKCKIAIVSLSFYVAFQPSLLRVYVLALLC